MSIRWFVLAMVLSAGVAAAEPARQPPRRRAAKLDQRRSGEARQGKIHVMKDVIVVGRDRRPMAVIDLSPERFNCSVGTARYSTTDRVHVPASSAERW